MAGINSFENVVVGQTASTLAQFILRPDQDITNAYITFHLLDENGTVYSTGNGSSLETIIKPNAKVIQSNINVSVPSNIPVNELGTTYQVRISLVLTSSQSTELYSNLTVLPETITYLGVGDIVDLKGNEIYAPILIEGLPTAINPIIYWQNEILPITPLTPSSATLTADGYSYFTTIDTNAVLLDGSGPAFYPSLEPYNLIWQYILYGNNCTESSSVWIATPRMLQAAKDLLSEINKARTSIRDKPTFSVTDAMLALRLGGDAFNGYADPTTFDFTNASGTVRHYWLAFSKIHALRAQYLYEAESNFDFQGNAIQLSVQREQYYESLAGAIENSVLEPAKQFKAVLNKRGNTDGDGNVNPNRHRAGSIGNVGVTYSAVSRLRPWNPNSWLGGQRSIF